MQKKTGQMEILGLAIVVVLVLLATIFVVRFIVLKSPAKYRQGFVTSELASNIVNTFLKTASRDCPSQLTMTELLQDCAQGKGIICDSKDSCKYVESTAKEIFESTLDKWNMDYEFIAYLDLPNPLVDIGTPCKAGKRSKLFPVPISAGTMYVKLEICEI